MENKNNQDENGQSASNINDSDLYANPFSNFNENDDITNNNNSKKENCINTNDNNNDLKENLSNSNEMKKQEENKNIKDKMLNDEQNINNNDINNINENIDDNKKGNINKKINISEEKISNNKEQLNASENKPKYFMIKETGSIIYIENTKKLSTMAIEKSFNKIYEVKDFNELLNLDIKKTYSVDAILGIIDINGNNKYILVVSSSNLIANIIGADIFNILDVDLIKITLFDETENEKNRINGVKKLFQSKNFYYSNKIDLCQNLFIKNRKNIINDFCVNSSLLKLFFENYISSEFYTKIIYGYVGFKKNIEIKNEKNSAMIDNIIIERVNKHLKFNSDIANHMKEIEFICIYKRPTKDAFNKNKYSINIFTFTFYVSNEIANNKIPFNPWNNFIMNELSQYPNIVCIINNNVNIDLNNNININNNSIKNIIFNSNQIGQKVKLLNFTSDWKKNLFFDSNNNSNNFIRSGSINPNNCQKYIFWFIDINNQFNENDYCFNTIIRLMWKSMQQQIYLMNLGINIGQFNKNNKEIICNNFKELIMNYHNDLDINKKSIYKSQMRKQLQKVFDYYFNNQSKINNSKINIYETNYNSNNNNNQSNQNNNQSINLTDSSNFNKNNLNAYQNVNITQIKNNNFANPFAQNNNMKPKTQIMNSGSRYNMNIANNNMNMNTSSIPKKLNILCLTWNVGGIPSEKKYDIRDLFTQNIFYKNNKIPDIIIIGLQEIVELDIYNILSITTNEENVSDWTKIIISTINSIYPSTFKQISVQNLVGIFCLCLVKSYLKDKIEILDSKVVKTGLFGTLGNKGYLTLNLKLFKNTDISFAVGHLEAGKNSNEQRISTLKQILSTKIGEQGFDDSPNDGMKFKNSDLWFIIGDLNFRIETSFEKSFELIQRREYERLIEFDQLYICRLRDGGLVDIDEAKINFPPTYKYISDSNNYVNDIENLRTPSWTDRILFCHKNNIRNLEYLSIPSIMYSDHRPVQASFEIDVKQQNRMDNINNYSNLYNNNINNYNNNYNNKFHQNIGEYINNNTNIGNNNYNMNNQNNYEKKQNYNEYMNNFRNNNDYNNWNGRSNNNNYNNNVNSAQNFNYLNNYNNQRNNFNYNNNFGNNGNNQYDKNVSNNYQNNNNQIFNQRTNQLERNINNPENHDIVKKAKTTILSNKKETNNNKNDNNNNDNDNIDNIMKFFK